MCGVENYCSSSSSSFAEFHGITSFCRGKRTQVNKMYVFPLFFFLIRLCILCLLVCRLLCFSCNSDVTPDPQRIPDCPDNCSFLCCCTFQSLSAVFLMRLHVYTLAMSHPLVPHYILDILCFHLSLQLAELSFTTAPLNLGQVVLQIYTVVIVCIYVHHG